MSTLLEAMLNLGFGFLKPLEQLMAQHLPPAGSFGHHQIRAQAELTPWWQRCRLQGAPAEVLRTKFHGCFAWDWQPKTANQDSHCFLILQARNAKCQDMKSDKPNWNLMTVPGSGGGPT